MQTIIGVLRVRNEQRWIKRVIESLVPVCERVIVLDDRSDDDTPAICESLGCQVIRSPFNTLNESRDKDFLLTEAFKYVPSQWHGRHDAPFWALAIDGDEVLVENDQPLVKQIVHEPNAVCYSLKIQYLWDSENQWRVDGVYKDFARPSLFRLMNPNFRYKTTPFGKDNANFHCSSIPQELLHYSRPSDARLLHFGYIDADLRRRKYEWYNTIDPNNHGEDCYRHCVQGDTPTVPAHARLKWAGPMELRPL